MFTLSLSMIVRNEAETIGRVLQYAKRFCDELIVVDTGSTDTTREISRAMGAKVYEFQWIDDFGAARNFSMERCTKDWIIWLDADDIVPQESIDRLKALKAGGIDDRYDAVQMPYRTAFDPQDRCVLSVMRERLFRRSAGYRWEYAIHEVITTDPKKTLTIENIYVDHRPFAHKIERTQGRNLRILENLYNRGDRSLQVLFGYGKELQAHERYDEAISVFAQYIKDSPAEWFVYEGIIRVADSHRAAGRLVESESALFDAIRRDPLRAEAFNKLGLHYLSQMQPDRAVPFLSAAAALERPRHGRSVLEENYTWMPHLFLSRCYATMGNLDKALEFNRKAQSTHPHPEQLVQEAESMTRTIGRKPSIG